MHLSFEFCQKTRLLLHSTALAFLPSLYLCWCFPLRSVWIFFKFFPLLSRLSTLSVNFFFNVSIVLSYAFLTKRFSYLFFSNLTRARTHTERKRFSLHLSLFFSPSYFNPSLSLLAHNRGEGWVFFCCSQPSSVARDIDFYRTFFTFLSPSTVAIFFFVFFPLNSAPSPFRLQASFSLRVPPRCFVLLSHTQRYGTFFSNCFNDSFSTGTIPGQLTAHPIKFIHLPASFAALVLFF